MASNGKHDKVPLTGVLLCCTIWGTFHTGIVLQRREIAVTWPVLANMIKLPHWRPVVLYHIGHIPHRYRAKKKRNSGYMASTGKHDKVPFTGVPLCCTLWGTFHPGIVLQVREIAVTWPALANMIKFPSLASHCVVGYGAHSTPVSCYK